MKTTTRVAASLVGAAALILTGALGAQAHVTVTPNTTDAGAYSVLTFSFGHACEGSPTTSMAIQIPEGINAATPTLNQGWTVEKVMAKLDTPIVDGHGNAVTERVDQIVYTAKEPIIDGVRDTFEIQVQLPEDAAEETLAFPTVQTCEQGETAWVQLPAAGQDSHDLDAPAPMFDVTAASAGHGDHAATPAAKPAAESASGDSVSSDSAGLGMGLGIAGLVAGVLGALLGGIALSRSGKKTA